ncbi:CBS domain-containing protein [Cystobacter fuscus]
MAPHHPEPPGSGTARPESTPEFTQGIPKPGEHASVPLTSRLCVRDVMSQKVSTLHASEALPLEELLKKFRHVRHLPVVGANSRLVGMVTRMDVLEEALLLGRERWVRVRDLLSCPVEKISENEGLSAAARAMRKAQVHSLPVVDASGRMVGILTDGDLLAAMAGEHLSAPGDPWELPVDTLMTHEPYTLGPDATLEEAAGVLIDADVRHLPVVDEDERLVGILSERDLRERLGGGARVAACGPRGVGGTAGRGDDARPTLLALRDTRRPGAGDLHRRAGGRDSRGG